MGRSAHRSTPGKFTNVWRATGSMPSFITSPNSTSTNSYARELAEKGAGEGEVVIAESQTQGRGRLGRRWESPPLRQSLFLDHLRPTLAPAHAPQITLMAAVALAETVGSFIPQAPTIKWPNDILVDGKKLAGILTEAACAPERMEYVILGIGVNVNYRIDSMPEEIRQRATSIADLTQVDSTAKAFCRRLIQALDRCYGELEESGFEALRAALGRRTLACAGGACASSCSIKLSPDGREASTGTAR